MNSRIKEILSKVYELEGLLRVAGNGNCDALIYQLILDKSAAVNEMTEKYTAEKIAEYESGDDAPETIEGVTEEPANEAEEIEEADEYEVVEDYEEDEYQDNEAGETEPESDVEPEIIGSEADDEYTDIQDEEYINEPEVIDDEEISEEEAETADEAEDMPEIVEEDDEPEYSVKSEESEYFNPHFEEKGDPVEEGPEEEPFDHSKYTAYQPHFEEGPAEEAEEESETSEPEEEPDNTIDTFEIDIEDEPEDEAEEEIEEGVRVDEVLQRSISKNLKKAFTLNDRFRYRRELFENSDVQMTNTLNLIETMNSFEEAEEYFYEDLAWDKESSEVHDFMEVIRKHFA